MPGKKYEGKIKKNERRKNYDRLSRKQSYNRKIETKNTKGTSENLGASNVYFWNNSCYIRCNDWL